MSSTCLPLTEKKKFDEVKSLLGATLATESSNKKVITKLETSKNVIPVPVLKEHFHHLALEDILKYTLKRNISYDSFVNCTSLYNWSKSSYKSLQVPSVAKDLKRKTILPLEDTKITASTTSSLAAYPLSAKAKGKFSKKEIIQKNNKMPRRNNRKAGKGRGGDSNSEDDSFNDNASMCSIVSEKSPSSVNDDVNANERDEEKFIKSLDNVTEKSAQTRAEALQTICELLMHRYMPDFIDDRKVTIIDCIEKSIRRGKGAEQAWAARLAPLVLLQLGGDLTISKTLNQLLLTTVQDKSVSFDARAKCCTSLGLLNFLGNDDIGNMLSVMQFLETIFSGSYLRGDEKTPISVTAEAGTLHAEALSAWGLLLTLVPSGDFVSWMNSNQPLLPSIKKLMGLLESPHLDVRMAAGEVIALILECGRAHDEEFLDDYLSDLIDAVKGLATDSHKYRAKRDRKAQRATFRDVLRYLEEDISPEVNIRFGTECLVLDSWSVQHQYESLCTIMGPGMTSHLQENDLIRDIFELGPKIMVNDGPPKAKPSKLERHLNNAAAFKARTISRNKNRDKRSAAFN